jgi:hypothetical protein
MNYEKKFYDAGFLIAGLMAILLAIAVLFTAPASAAKKKPNILIIWGDDVGQVLDESNEANQP